MLLFIYPASQTTIHFKLIFTSCVTNSDNHGAEELYFFFFVVFGPESLLCALINARLVFVLVLTYVYWAPFINVNLNSFHRSFISLIYQHLRKPTSVQGFFFLEIWWGRAGCGVTAYSIPKVQVADEWVDQILLSWPVFWRKVLVCLSTLKATQDRPGSWGARIDVVVKFVGATVVHLQSLNFLSKYHNRQ